MKFYITIAVVLFINCGVYGKSVNDYKQEINSKSQELDSVQKTIQEKKLQKEIYQKNEESTKKELNEVESKVSSLKLKGAALKKEITKAQQNLKRIGQELRFAGWEKGKWKDTINKEADLFNRYYYGYFRVFSDLVSEKLYCEVLSKKKEYMVRAEKKESIYKISLGKWQAAQKKLLELETQLIKTTSQHKDLKKQKEKLLETAIGKRVAAENEIRELEASKQELKQLLSKLSKEKKKSEQEIAAKKAFKEKRKQLPWPLTGKVITNFGRNKHPDLDTYLISNGIKILSQNSAVVKAVSGGEVMFCGEFRAYGQMVILDHGGGFYTIYGHLGEISVKEGGKVKTNDPVGTLNSNGDKNAVLYFEVRSDGVAEDPMLWLK
ncbi:MAG: peptidoglycan DD-metalloendopeptidase family protein [Elusimicrobia bacterium]|nr:peptidoglycan DD-metalloendopeptidase family protein [Candidatus Liberimonas magnetica]